MNQPIMLLVWHPPVEMLAGRDLKAVFALGAGVDSILSKLQAHPEMLRSLLFQFFAWKIPVWASKCRICCQSGAALVSTF